VTASELIALLTGVLSVAETLEAQGIADPAGLLLSIVNEHPAVQQAQAAVAAELAAKFPKGAAT
jgi:hypothetical protein